MRFEFNDLLPTPVQFSSLVGEEAVIKNNVKMCHFRGKRGNIGDKDDYRPAFGHKLEVMQVGKTQKEKARCP